MAAGLMDAVEQLMQSAKSDMIHIIRYKFNNPVGCHLDNMDMEKSINSH